MHSIGVYMKRKISLVLCMLILAAAMVCQASPVSLAETAYDEAKARSTAETMFTTWNQMLEEGQFALAEDEKEQILTQYGEEAQEAIDVYDAWNDLYEQLGDYVEIKDASYTESDGIITVTLTVKYTEGDMSFSVPVNASSYELAMTDFSDVKADIIKSLSQQMKEAGLNTVMGLVIVFFMLIFMSFVFSLFKFVNRPEKKAPEAPAAPVAAPAPTAEETAESEVDDGELVAVITAAIMASMKDAGQEVPADGLVVRSIKRRNKKSWQNA